MTDAPLPPDSTSRELAERFGAVALARMAAGREPYWSSRLAFSYAIEVLGEDRGAVVAFARRGGQHGPF